MFHDQVRRPVTGLVGAALLALMSQPAEGADRLIRGKQPDRGTYSPPVVRKGEVKKVVVTRPTFEREQTANENNNSQLVPAPLLSVEDSRARGSSGETPRIPRPVVLSAEEIEIVRPAGGSATRTAGSARPSKLRPVGFEEAPQLKTLKRSPKRKIVLEHIEEAVVPCSCESCTGGITTLGSACDAGCCDSMGCDSLGCDSMCCDSMACLPKGRLGLPQRGWFGSVELLLMFRKGDRLPPLVTTGPDTDPDTAGQLGQADTGVLAGGEILLRDMTPGGRLTIGRWLDCYKDRSLVARGWFAGQKDYNFSVDESQRSVIARPFFNVTDGQTPAQDAQLIAFPARTDGVATVSADSNVYGADISIRQLWRKHCGMTVDLLYGYQYVGLDERLGIATRSVSLDDDFAPVGAIISVADAFDVNNDFHGGQVGFATSYRQGCWSFSTLGKLGFGSLSRRANLSGRTVTSIDGNVAVDPNGLLVRQSNAGSYSDNTFAWVPELDLTIGWQQFPSFDVTFGYQIVAMTDALQVSGTMDPQLGVNFADTGAPRPVANLRYETYYVQGMHFGISYIY